MEELSPEIQLELKTLFDGLSKTANVRIEEKVQNAGDSNDEGGHFATLQARLEELVENVKEKSLAFYKILTMQNSILYEEAKLRMMRDDTASSEELLEKTLKNIYDHREHPHVVFLYLRIVNHLAYILSKKGDLQKAQELLDEVSKPVGTNILVYSTEELFNSQDVDQSQAHNKLGKLMANNLQMLGWVYGKMGNHEMYTLKLHEALQQLLKTYDNDLVHWACRCIRLALLYLNRCQYVPARYHLAAAGTVLDNLEVSLSPHPELGKAQADLARCWIHYGLHLFGTSKTYILEKMCTEDIFSLVTLENDPPVPEEKLSESLVFENLEVVPQPVPATIIKTTDQARSLFSFTQMWLKRVRVYYTIRDYPILYVNAILNQSELNRYMAFYEPDLDSQYKVQKMRADSLEQLSGILKEVRPKCYIAISVELLRELAEVQIELMSINLRKLYSQGQANSESEIRRRIHAVSDIHSKLEGVGDMMGHSNLVDQELLQGSDPTLIEDQPEEAETTDSAENANEAESSENSEP